MELLATQATRQRVKDILSLEGRRLITEIVKLEEAQKDASISTSAPLQSVASSRRYQIKLNNYGKQTYRQK